MAKLPDLTILDPEECWAALERASIGRLGLHAGALPLIVPVQYALLAGAIVFRTFRGFNIGNAINNSVVAFEVGDTDFTTDEGWSVVAVGFADPVTDQETLDVSHGLSHDRWTPGESHGLMRIEPRIISGRRIVQRIFAH